MCSLIPTVTWLDLDKTTQLTAPKLLPLRVCCVCAWVYVCVFVCCLCERARGENYGNRCNFATILGWIYTFHAAAKANIKISSHKPPDKLALCAGYSAAALLKGTASISASMGFCWPKVYCILNTVNTIILFIQIKTFHLGTTSEV